MTLKDKIISELPQKDYKIKYYTKSPYQSRRYKPKYVEEECWLYLKSGKLGYCITTSDWNNPNFKKMVLSSLV